MAKKPKAEVSAEDVEDSIEAASFKSLMNGFKKTYGETCLNIDRLEELQGPTIPTVLSLDIALNGGIQAGTITNLSSFPKTGKTTLALTIIAKAQKQGYRCFYEDVEGRLQKELLRTIPMLSLTEADQAKGWGYPLTIVQSTKGNIMSAEKNLQMVKDLIKNQSRILVVIDSLAALCPEGDYDNNLNENGRMGGTQQLLYRFFRHITPVMRPMEAILINISHLQVKIGGYGGKPTSYGGAAPDYFASNRLVSYKTAKLVPESSDPKIGQDITFTITATALGTPNKECTLPLRYGYGIDEYEDLYNVAEPVGKISKVGTWCYYTTSKDEEIKMQGKANMVEWFRENKEEAALLDKELREMLITPFVSKNTSG
jgi:recombination protein RecA